MIDSLVGGVTSYPGLFLFCAASGIAVPFPEDVSLLYAGLCIASGEFTWGPALVAATLGVLVRDVAAYTAGRTIGDWLLAQPLIRRVLGVRRIQRARALVEERGAAAVLFGRFLVGMRASVFLVAGATGVSFRRFLIWDLVGMLATVPAVMGLGYAFGEPILEISLWAIQQARIVAVLVLATVVVIAVRRFRAAGRDEALLAEAGEGAGEEEVFTRS